MNADAPAESTSPSLDQSGGIRPWFRSTLDFFYPPACAHCGESTPSGSTLCRLCRDLLIGEPTDVCQRCSAPVGPHLETSQGCIHCRQDRFAFKRVFALGPYESALRNACLRIKHQPTEGLSPVLTDLMLERWGAELRSLRIDVVVPIPAHWTTRLSRVSRPADVIAHRVGRFLKAPCDLHILRKSRRTPAQSTLTPARRRENLRDTFRLVGGVRLGGLRVLLVDDVLTTGTTADRAARVLRQSGSGEVFVAVLAHGIGR